METDVEHERKREREGGRMRKGEPVRDRGKETKNTGDKRGVNRERDRERGGDRHREKGRRRSERVMRKACFAIPMRDHVMWTTSTCRDACKMQGSEP